MNRRFGAGLFAFLLAARLCHWRVLWVEESYPMAGAIQVLHGLIPYRDFWYDKPPLAILFYLPFGAYDGIPLRIAGALYAFLCCWLIHRFALELWGEREARTAAMLLGFFLVFGIHSAVTAIAPDLLLLAPHIAAVHFAWQKRPFAAGLIAALGFLANTKAVFIVAACALFCPSPKLALGFLPGMLPLAWPSYWEQVIWWGRVYARNTFLDAPWREGLVRTANWAGFHAALVIPAVMTLRVEWRFAIWALLMLASAALGERFFPRYYFALLPPLVLAASRTRWRTVMFLLLLIPAARFGPRYVQMAMGEPWRDLALFDNAVEVSNLTKRNARSGDTIFVWGYRPEIYVLTRMKLGTPFLESQPLSGVFADRHLSNSTPVVEIAFLEQQRRRFDETNPTWVIDGLGPLNPKLAFERADYELVHTTPLAKIYRSKR